jgi:hypothetical protein
MNKFSQVARSLALTALLAAPAAPLLAQSGTGFSGIGVTNSVVPAVASNLQYYAIPPNPHAPVVTYVQASLAGSEVSNANAQVRFRYPTGEEIKPTSAGISGTNAMTVGSTNGLTTSDIYLFQKGSSGPFQRLTPASFGTGLITFNETLATTIATGDKLWKMDLRGRLAGGNAAFPATSYRDRIEANSGQSVFVGKAGAPALVEVFGTNFPVLHNVSGRYGFWQP